MKKHAYFRNPTAITDTANRGSALPHLSLISQEKLSPQNAREALDAAYVADDYLDCIKDLRGLGIDPQAYIDGLDQIVNCLLSGSDDYYRCLRAMRKSCGIYGILPVSYCVPPDLTLVTTGKIKRPFASGGFADVWKAENNKGQMFAIKSLRMYQRDDLARAKKKYCKDVTVCRRVRHENVLNIEGVAPELFEFCMVTRWMDNGNMLDYVRTKEDIDRMSLLLGITRGLHHLHSNRLIHGDLKGPNILIDSMGTPLLADFGLSSIAKYTVSVNASTPYNGGTVRWTAPELLDVLSEKYKKQTPTVESDVYALSMVIIELYTGSVPFPDSPDPTVILLVARGGRPPKPVSAETLGLSSAVWELTKRCWHKNPAKRPNSSEVLAYLEEKKVVPPPPFLKRFKRFLSR